MRRRDNNLRPGQRFKALDGLFWDIQYVVKTASNLPHAKLIGVGDHTATKLISVDALLDQHLYKFVENKAPRV